MGNYLHTPNDGTIFAICITMRTLAFIISSTMGNCLHTPDDGIIFTICITMTTLVVISVMQKKSFAGLSMEENHRLATDNDE